MSALSYLELGATLFIPASHHSLVEILSGEKYPTLRSLVVDFEDGLEESAFIDAMNSMEESLSKIGERSPLVFLRAKNVSHLKILLKMANIKTVTGFVLAKFSLKNVDEYLSSFEETKFYIMPSIEGKELFSSQKLHELKDKILTNKQSVLAVRFGLEDMLKQLSMRRECGESVFDLSVTATIIGNFIAIFKSAGFGVSGGVYPCFKDSAGFKKDVIRDLKEGLFSKTIIHPSQIEIVNELYRVEESMFQEALEISSSESAVFAQNEKMAEVVTMSPHSEMIIKRANIYGLS